jgi:hypothetical protein
MEKLVLVNIGILPIWVMKTMHGGIFLFLFFEGQGGIGFQPDLHYMQILPLKGYGVTSSKGHAY